MSHVQLMCGDGQIEVMTEYVRSKVGYTLFWSMLAFFGACFLFEKCAGDVLFIFIIYIIKRKVFY